jgi:regulatory protein
MIEAVPPSGETPGFDEAEKSSPRIKRVLKQDVAQADGKKLPPAETAYRRIVDLCGYHEFCCAKIRERLLREGMSEDAVDQAVSRAVRVGLIDDLRWGEMRISALMRKGKGSEGIRREMRENGIAVQDIDGWPDGFIARYGDDFERAMNCIRKSPPRSKNPRASAYSKLMRKGYSAQVAAQVSAAWFEECKEIAADD